VKLKLSRTYQPLGCPPRRAIKFSGRIIAECPAVSDDDYQFARLLRAAQEAFALLDAIAISTPDAALRAEICQLQARVFGLAEDGTPNLWEPQP
jgi:hypothetical protein